MSLTPFTGVAIADVDSANLAMVEFSMSLYDSHLEGLSISDTSTLTALGLQFTCTQAGGVESCMMDASSTHVTKEDYEAGVELVTYNNGATEPDPTSRVITISVTDDASGNSNSEQASIAITLVNDNAPVLARADPGLVVTFAEQTVSPVSLGAFTISDADDNSLFMMTSAQVSLTVMDIGSEFLISDYSGVDVTVSGSNTGTIDISGSATVSIYASVLGQISYKNVANEPQEGSRAISFHVNDENGPSNILATTVSVTMVNDRAPIISGLSGATFTEPVLGQPAIPVSFATGLVLTDTDGGATSFQSATVSITSGAAGSEIPAVSASLLAAKTDISKSDITNGIVLTGPASISDVSNCCFSVSSYFFNIAV